MSPGPATPAVVLFSGSVLINELAQTLAYAKFARRLNAAGTSAQALVAHYATLVHLVTPIDVPRVVSGDADDDHVIAATASTCCRWVCTAGWPSSTRPQPWRVSAAEGLHRHTHAGRLEKPSAGW